jgi:hypothetical protein
VSNFTEFSSSPTVTADFRPREFANAFAGREGQGVGWLSSASVVAASVSPISYPFSDISSFWFRNMRLIDAVAGGVGNSKTGVRSVTVLVSSSNTVPEVERDSFVFASRRCGVTAGSADVPEAAVCTFPLLSSLNILSSIFPRFSDLAA